MPLEFAEVHESVVFLAAILVSSILLPLVVPLFKRWGLVDRPNARSAHNRAIPRGVGLVVVAGFWLTLYGYNLFEAGAPLTSDGKFAALLISSLLVVGMGFLDDVRRVPATLKLLVQCAAALILILAGFVIPLPQIFGDLQVWAESAFTFVWFILAINAINFIDGSDGLCTSLSSICMLLFVVLSHLIALECPKASVGLTKMIYLLGFAAAGSALPFLLYNMAPAKCFLGDAGSTFFGLMLAVLGVLVAQYAQPFATPSGKMVSVSYRYLLVPWIVLFVPVGDSVRVAVFRLLRKRSPFRPDNTHLHHLLHRAGLSPNQMVFSVTLLVIISGLIAAFVVQSNPSHYLWVAIGALVLLGQLWFLKSSYRVRRFVTALMNKRLLESGEVPPGYENPPLFKERLEQELARAKRRQRPLSLVVVTVTGRKLNQPGASPLENPKFLEDLLNALRREDIKGRFSNDRLAFLLVETEREVAEEVTKRIQARFAAIRDGESGDLQYGIGLSSFPVDGDKATDLFKVAEEDAAAKCTIPHPAPSRVDSKGMGKNGSRFQSPLNPPRTRLPELGGSS